MGLRDMALMALGGAAETRDLDSGSIEFDKAISVDGGVFAPTAGEDVTIENTMRAAMGACIRLLADDIATLPWQSYRKVGETVEKTDKPDWMVHPEGHRFSFPTTHKADAVVSLLSDGNLFVEGLGPGGTINPRALYVIPPER